MVPHSAERRDRQIGLSLESGSYDMTGELFESISHVCKTMYRVTSTLNLVMPYTLLFILPPKHESSQELNFIYERIRRKESHRTHRLASRLEAGYLQFHMGDSRIQMDKSVYRVDRCM